MAPSSRKMASAIGATAALTGGAAFLAGPAGGEGQQSTSLRAGTNQARFQQVAYSGTSSSSSSSVAVASASAVLALAAAGQRKKLGLSKPSATTLRAFETELGVQPPVGFWDPIGFTIGGDAASFRRRRYIELKHGRVAMIACLGYITPEYYRFPGDLSPSLGLKFTDMPTGFAAFSKVPQSGWAQMIAFAGSIELFQYVDDPTRAPGDFKNAGSLGVPNGYLRISDPETKKKKLSAEIANGRLAMMAIMGMFFQDGLTGSAWGDWSLYTDSPLRAFENELGVTLPMKYFDPLGMAKDGDAETFRRRRVAEVKNGRVAMWACMGYIVPEYFRWPGFCSPSLDLKFTDMPNGIAALYKMPAEGWAQIGCFIAYLELFPMRQEKDALPGDAPGFGKLGVPFFARKADPVGSRRSLEAEINNGRLAMVAITGMVAQNAFFGSTGPEMWLPSGAFEGELGVQAPVGFWDPLRLAADGDADNFKRRRAVELKHGRICMLATIGYIVPEYFRWPGYLSPSQGLKFTDVPHGIAAISKVPLEGWLQIGLFLGHYEGYFFAQDPKRAPGDFEGYGFLGAGKNFIFNFDPVLFTDVNTKKKKLSAEIANGRLAMVALMAMLFQNGTVGTTGPEMWLPPAAFENELGVQPPIGFWDPAGFTADGDAKDFYRRRCIEVKHGRVSMLACLGYIVPEFVKLPGYLSPSSNIAFADVPTGLAAVNKVPAVGWFQYTIFCGICDLWLMHQVPANPPGKLSTRLFGEGTTNYEYGSIGLPGYLGGQPIADAELKKKKLNAELANGRLAMMAIIGMFFQDGLTGSAWGDWALYADSPMRAGK